MPNLCGTGLQKLKQSVIFAQARSLTADIPGIERHLTKLNMKNYSLRLISLCLAGWGTLTTYAQTYSSSSNLTAQPEADRIVPFRLSEPGIVREVEWGADEAWLDEANVRRSVAFMGKDNVSVMRVSFQPTYPLVDGDLQQAQKDTINERIRILGFCKDDVKLCINCDHPSVDDSYIQNAEAWANLIDVTARYYQDAGYEVVSVAPFNEPDFGWNQWVPGSQDANEKVRQEGFRQVAIKLRENPRFDNIRICGGNTLNCDGALSWFNYLKDYIDEGNTHQLAGSFDNFANFYITVRNNNKHATADEMHNVMEAMVGMEYGLQTGIWWGSAEYARGEFCKASHGERLAYAEHRPNWTAASVYRAPDGKVQAFGGTSERQAATTTYRFLSKDRDVFFDGHGPQREYVMELPGGTGYQNGQTGAERVVNITWGDDIAPVVDGTYVLYNRYAGRVLDNNAGTPTMSTYSSTKTSIRWNVNPVDARIGGDYSYHQVLSASTRQTLDVLNFSMEDGADIIMYNNDKKSNQQWYLEYAGDGWFRIRSRNSSLCLAASGNKIIQAAYDADLESQQWRFIPVGTRPRIRKIDTPADVTAEGRASSILLTWKAVDATDPTYTILRSEKADSDYEIIARGVTDTAFVDNKAMAGHTYYYTVKTVDACVNSSEASTAVNAAVNGGNDLIARYEFEGNANDTTLNLRHAALSGTTYAEGRSGNHSLQLNGSTDFAQLPTSIAQSKEITIATWMKWKGGNDWQRVFDFGNGEDEYLFLTPRADNGKLRFAIKNGGDEQRLEGTSMTSYRKDWVHIALTMDEESVCLYQDGELIASSTDITLRPSDIQPLLNYIGHSQFAADPNFNGCIDDFRVYDYALNADEIKKLTDVSSGICGTPMDEPSAFSVSPLPADSHLDILYQSDNGTEKVEFRIYDLQGHLAATASGQNGTAVSIRTSHLADGVYILKAQCGTISHSKKFTVRHP